MEKHELVDKNGNNTGVILSHEKIYDKNNIPCDAYLSVVGVVIVNDNDEILLQKRSKVKKSNPGKWGICGGKVNLGETTYDAIIRETIEEIGINLDKEKLKPIRKAVNGKNYFTIFFTRKNVDLDECKLREEELEEVKYFKIKDLKYLESEGFEWLENLKKEINYNEE